MLTLGYEVLCNKQTMLEIDSLWPPQPVKSVSQQRDDVIETFLAVDEPSGHVEYRLDAIQLITWQTY